MKKVQSSFRLRSYFCKVCKIHWEVFGTDSPVVMCKCSPQHSIPVLEWDQWITTIKTIEAYPPGSSK